MNSRLRRPSLALLATALAVSVVGLTPSAEAAAGAVIGTVTGPEGVPVADADVSLYAQDTESGFWYWADSAFTDASGAYTISALPGDYRVAFDDISGVYADEYFENASDVDTATTITVPDGGPVDVSAELAPAAHITGHVTGPGPTDLEDVRVIAYRVVNPGGVLDFVEAGSALTAADGTYDIIGLSAGSYRVEFNDGQWGDESSIYATEYYADQSTVEGAADVTLIDSEVKGDIDAELALDFQISGLITDEVGDPITDAWVEALAPVGSQWAIAGYAYTGVNGTYTLDGLPAGTYRVQLGADVFTGTDFAVVAEYWENVGQVADATDVELGGPVSSVAGIDAQLVAGEHDPVSGPVVVNTSRPTIMGEARTGATLTVDVGSWTPTPSDYGYDWMRDGEFIVDAHEPTYVPTAADVGASLSVWVTAGAPGHEFGYAESVATAPVVQSPKPTSTPTPTPTPTRPTPTSTPAPPAPTVDVPAGLAAIMANLDTSGKPKVGKTLKVSGLDTLLRTTVSYKFQWLAGAKKIKKATTSKLKVTRAMKGKKISVKVTATAASTSTSITLKFGKVR